MVDIIMDENDELVIKSNYGLVELECNKGHISIKKRVEFKNLPNMKDNY